MPIRWNTLKVTEAADKIEELTKKAAEPLEQARNVAKEAKKLPNLPQYIEQGFTGILGEIERVTGGEHSFDQAHYDGGIKRAIDRLRGDIPKDAIQSDQVTRKYGSTQSLI